MADLPPLNALRVFDAVARHGNLTRAAAELNMTQSAVSYQVKLLEGFAGGPLFQRLARGVVLTERGRMVAPTVQKSFADLRAAFGQLRHGDEQLLVISTMHTIASSWLAPRLGKLQLAHPGLAVRLDVTSDLVDFTQSSTDVAIRSGKGHWPGLASHLLMDQTFTPVASPAYLAREGRPATPRDVLDHVLVAPSDDWWPLWFEAAGIPGPLTIRRPGIDVETQQMTARVAAAGNGIALLTPGFAQDELDAGLLVRLFDIEASAQSSYFLVYPETSAKRRKIALFRDWILAEAGRR